MAASMKVGSDLTRVHSVSAVTADNDPIVKQVG